MQDLPEYAVRIEDVERFQALEQKIHDALASGDAEEEVITPSAELDRLKLPPYDYLHEIVDNRANKPIVHAQIVFDISLLSTIVQRYLRQLPRKPVPQDWPGSI
ncbi:hypothetical protein ACFPME_12095 [Rhodanobacter umsongensis]|uniref:Uncharacterized protein n=1 Tax=Rhodanobacter umsongensis TaxID=633153 RepID=A0ABW0JMN7_9GAMM